MVKKQEGKRAMETPICIRVLRYPLVLMIGALICTIGGIIGGQSLSQYIPAADGSPLVILKAIVAAGFCVLGYCLFEHFAERRTTRDFALSGAFPEWLAGIAFGGGLFTLVVGVTWALGGYRITGWNGAHILYAGVAMAIASGVVEEILLRGIIFRFVEAAAGSVISIIFSAGLFGVLHIANPNASWIAALAIAIEAGVMLAAVYMLTRRLWAAIGVHMAWNFMQGPIFGVPVSGIKEPGLAKSVMNGPNWMTGGEFGLEASLTATILASGAGLILLWMAWQRGRFIAAPWQRKAELDT
jgi:uncharacterized protein